MALFCLPGPRSSAGNGKYGIEYCICRSHGVQKTPFLTTVDKITKNPYVFFPLNGKYGTNLTRAKLNFPPKLTLFLKFRKKFSTHIAEPKKILKGISETFFDPFLAIFEKSRSYRSRICGFVPDRASLILPNSGEVDFRAFLAKIALALVYSLDFYRNFQNFRTKISSLTRAKLNCP